MTAEEEGLRQTLQEKPENWELRLELLEKLRGRGAWEEVAQVLGEAPVAPGSERELQQVVNAAGEAKQPGLARPLVGGFLEAQPQSALGHYLQAKICAKTHDLEAAREHYQRAIGLNGDLEDEVLAAKLADLGATQRHEPGSGAQAGAGAGGATPSPAPLTPPAPSGVGSASAAEPASEPQAASKAAAPAPLTPPPGSGIERAPEPPATMASVPPSAEAQELLEEGGWSEAHEGELTATGRHLLVVEGGGEVHAHEPTKTGRQKLTALTVALLIHVGLIGLFGMIALALPQPKPPEIVATAQAPLDQDDMLQQQEIEKQVQRKPVQSAQNQMEVVTVQGASAVSMPDIETDLTSFEPIGIGDAFGASMTFDAGEDGGMVSFFGSKTMSKKVVFAVDYSGSMSGVKDRLMRKELAKSINALPGGIQYQMIFFHGPAWVAGEEVIVRGSDLDEKDPFTHYIVMTGERGREEFKWYMGYDENSRVKKGSSNRTAMFYPETGSEEPEKLPQAEYMTSTRSNIRKSLELIEETPLAYGTDWRWPLYMAMNMEPDTIYFMTDGAFGARKGLLESLVDYNRKKGRAKINTISMMVPRAAHQLEYLADETRGEFSLVLEDETVVRGEELEKLLDEKR